MSFICVDRVKETTATAGTGSLTLNGAVSGYKTFASRLTTNDTCYYCISNGDAWEVGLGTFTSPSTLTRSIISSSNSDALINLSGSSTVYITAPANQLNPVYNSPEISITSASALALNNMHVCTGTSADYAITLPTAVGNTNRIIGVRISTACTKLITLTAYGAETIDGSTTRIMWAGESAILKSDGTGWVKIAGKSIPMYSGITQGSNQAITSGIVSDTQVNLDTATTGAYTTMVDAANKKLVIKRPGKYAVSLCMSINNNNGSATYMVTKIKKNSAVSIAEGHYYSAASKYATPQVSRAFIDFALADTIYGTFAFETGSYTSNYATAPGEANTALTIHEILTW